MKQAGQVILFNFPQTNLLPGKSRPGLLIAKLPGSYDDWLISMISTQTHQYIGGIDEIIKKESADFIQSGLKAESVIRTARLAVVAGEILIGTIGQVSPERLTRIRKNLSDWISSDNLAE